METLYIDLSGIASKVAPFILGLSPGQKVVLLLAVAVLTASILAILVIATEKEAGKQEKGQIDER